MWIIILSISAALLVALMVSKFSTSKEEPAEAPPADCCGAHEVCDKESLMAHAHGEVIYFNDEELDLFKGKAPDQYSPEEIDQFREVLQTMQTNEVGLWMRSLLARSIKMPLDVREEALTIVKAQKT